MMRTFGDDDRALANNIAIFFCTIILGFLLAIVFEPAGEMMLDIAALETERESSAQGQQYLRWTWESLHLIVIGFGVVQLLVAAVWESRVTV